MKKGGTLFVEATIQFEESDEFDSRYHDYYDMQWSSSFRESEAYFISNTLRSKVLEFLSHSCYREEDAFTLKEAYTYDFSDIESLSISDIVR